jgi:hypothetical protein
MYLGINRFEIAAGMCSFAIKKAMKKMFYSRLIVMLFTLLSVSLSAQDVFYVSASGNDANPGTQAQPWLTLNVNANQWTNGCTVKISGEVYTTAKFTPNRNVTLEGITPDAAVQGLSDADFAYNVANSIDNSVVGMININPSYTVTAKNLTFKNIWTASTVLGGAFQVQTGGVLNLENCVFSNLVATGACNGAAIMCTGEVHAQNTVFDNNSGQYGGAVQLQCNDAVTKIIGEFTNCTFTNNTASGEAIVNLNSIKKCEASFDGCYFYNNRVTGNGQGGGISLIYSNNTASIDTKLTVVNSSFISNYAGGGGGAAIGFKGDFNGSPATAGVLDFTIANCTFYDNTSPATNGTVISTVNMGGAKSNVNVTGTHVFANNTFFRNPKNEESGYAAIFLYAQMGSDLYFVNNLLLEETWSGSVGLVVESNTDAFQYNSYTVKNNIFGLVGGSSNLSWAKSFHKEVYDAGNNNTILPDNNWTIQPADKAVSVGLATTLTAPATGVPYLALTDASGLAVDFGISSVLAGAANIVPQTDIASNPVSGNSRDAGAHEYIFPAFVVAANLSRSWTDYVSGNYGDIIIESTDASTGQLTGITSGAAVNGVVKLQKTFGTGKWYAVGFPFAIASVTAPGVDYNLETYDESGVNTHDGLNGDYWARTYDGTNNVFNDYTAGSTNLAAGGYIIAVPSAFDGEELTFTSAPGITLNTTDAAFDFTQGGYKITANPSLINRILTPGTTASGDSDDYYCLGSWTDNAGNDLEYYANNFGLVAASKPADATATAVVPSSYTLKPFESVVVARAITLSAGNSTGNTLRSFMGTENVDTPTGINAPSLDDEPVSVRCYNLQGIEIAQPAKGQAYIVREVYKSGAVKARKAVK